MKPLIDFFFFFFPPQSLGGLVECFLFLSRSLSRRKPDIEKYLKVWLFSLSDKTTSSTKQCHGVVALLIEG